MKRHTLAPILALLTFFGSAQQKEVVYAKMDFEALDVQRMEITMAGKIDSVEMKLTKQIDSLEMKLTKQIAETNERILEVKTELMDKITEATAVLHSDNKTPSRWLIGILIALFGFLIMLLA